ncbi:MAG: M14-type cytosolic carboxypeptidase [Pirellulales bacterium]
MSRRIVVTVALAALLAGFATSAFGQLSITANFDHGSLASWSGSLSAINLTGRTNFYGTEWRWMYFKATGIQGATPIFTINQNFAGDATPGLHELQEHEMVYSYDNQNWHFFDNNQLLATNTDLYRFSNSTPFTQNEVYVAYALPYSYGKSVAHTQAVLASPWAAPTVSANANGVIGQSKPGTDDLLRSVPALDLFAYRITDPATDSATPKRKVGITSGLHSGEPLGTHTFEGLVNWLISDDPRAARLRDIAEFFAYPVLNPTGRYAGMNRTMINNPSRDPNGLWDSTRWNSSSLGCGSNNCQEIRESGEAMIADVASTPGNYLDAFIDFHSTVPDYANPTGLPHDFGFVDSDDSNTDWWLEVQRLMDGNLIEYTTGGSGDFTTTGFARRRLNAAVEITLETQFTWERNVDYYHNLGKAFGVAFYNSWVPQVDGDYTGDGMVDARDYILWRSTLNQTGTGLLADGNRDNIVNANDYNIWRAHFGMTAGSGSGTSPSHSPVPEPASLALLTASAAFLCGGLLRRR